MDKDKLIDFENECYDYLVEKFIGENKEKFERFVEEELINREANACDMYSWMKCKWSRKVCDDWDDQRFGFQELEKRDTGWDDKRVRIRSLEKERKE